MNEELTEDPKTARKITDIALLIVAFAAIASWVWRRLRRSATVDSAPSADAEALDDKVAGSVGFPPNAPV